MGDTIASVLPLAVGIALSPVPIIAAIVLLLSPRARAASVGFLVGWVLGIVTAVSLFFVFAAIVPAPNLGGSHPVQGAIHLILGLVLIVLSVRQFRQHARAQGAPVALPTWMRAIDHFGFWDALGLGVLLAAVNPKNLLLGASAGVSLGNSTLTLGPALVVVAVYTVVAASTILVPVVAALTAGRALAHPLGALRAWLEREHAVIMGVVMLVLGVVVLSKGIASFA